MPPIYLLPSPGAVSSPGSSLVYCRALGTWVGNWEGAVRNSRLKCPLHKASPPPGLQENEPQPLLGGSWDQPCLLSHSCGHPKGRHHLSIKAQGP